MAVQPKQKQKDTAATQTDNPYEHVIAGLTLLPRVKDYLKSKNIPDRVPRINIAALYRGNPPLVRYVIYNLIRLANYPPWTVV